MTISFVPVRDTSMANAAEPMAIAATQAIGNAQLLVTGALLACEPGPRVVLARHIADSTDETGRAHLLRLARMVAGRDGRLYVQVQTARVPEGGEPGVKPLDVDAFLAQVRELGGRVLERRDLAVDDGGEVPAGSAAPTICRLVITWSP